MTRAGQSSARGSQGSALRDLAVSMQQTGGHAVPLLTTKLYRPPILPGLEPRDALLKRLSRNRQRPLTLISAPAGYGKSTLASMWLEASACPSAWVALDEGDNDLRTFTSYLLAALSRTFPGSQLETWNLLEAPVLPGLHVLARYLLNDLDQIEEPFILALDDVHMVHEQVVFDLLGELLRHPSPNMHLVLITRRDPPLPIPSMRARGQINEVRSRDLRFTVPEAGRLLSRILQREVDETTAAEWTKRTEGWVTALQLAALSLAHRDRGDALRGDIPVDSRYLQDYLLTEVLAQLDPVRQARLLATSLLDRFCGPLCEAIWPLHAASDEEAYTGERFIRWLQEANLFLIPLDEQQLWFRLHHLFQDLLQQLLRKSTESDEITAIHRRASQWFANNGLIDEAIRHAVAADDMIAAVQAVVQNRYELMNAQQWHRLYRWLQLLPSDVVTQNPHLMSIKIMLGTHLYTDLDLVSDLRQGESLLSALPQESEDYQVVWAEIAVHRALRNLILGDPARALAGAQQGLQLLPAQAIFVRMLAKAVVAGSLQMQGEYKLGFELMKEALADPRLPPGPKANGLHHLCFICMVEGDLAEMMAAGRECLQISEAEQIPWTVSNARQHLGVAHYFRNELEEAESYLRALLKDRLVSAPNRVAFGSIALALIQLSRSQWAEAVQVIDLACAEFSQMRDKGPLEILEAFRVELALWQGDLAAAQRLSTNVDFEVWPPRWFFYVPQLTPIKLLWAEGGSESLAKARAALESFDERMAVIHRKTIRIDVLSLLALVCDAQGDTAAAYDRLAEALRLAETGGFIRNFVDLGQPMADLLARLYRQSKASQPGMLPYIARILAVFPKTGPQGSPTKLARAASRPVAPSPLFVEPLTERESQILKLLASELSPEDMARELSLSTSTVRTHIRNVYSKLDVHSRFEALHRARELRML